jgi:cytochrome P450
MPDTATSTAPVDVPSFDFDLHDEQILVDPFPTYKQIRDAGPVVWLEHQQVFIVGRFAEVTEVLTTHEVFGSKDGIGLNELVCSVFSTLMSDVPEHDRLRRIENRPLLPKAVRQLEPQLRELAERTVLDLKERGGWFDGVRELSSVLPLGIVAEVIGLPEDGKAKMLQWAADGFDAFGLMENERVQKGLMGMAEAGEYMESAAERLKPGSWGAMLIEAERNGELEEGEGVGLLNDYLYPALDTTISGIAGGLKLFSENPDQWDLLRNDRSLMRAALSEIMRLSAPIQWFARRINADYELGGVTLPKDHQVIVLYASANRDERKFEDPERFDITRKHVAEQVGWGKGKHACVGMPLARLEMHVVFSALAEHVERIETGDHTIVPNTTLWGYKTLETKLS